MRRKKKKTPNGRTKRKCILNVAVMHFKSQRKNVYKFVREGHFESLLNQKTVSKWHLQEITF